MFATCLFCDASFGRNSVLEHLPTGRRFAYDPAKGRVWVVCRACDRWNLTPLDDRLEVMEEMESIVTTSVAAPASTPRVSLVRRGGIELIRLGVTDAVEIAAWRYGSRLHHRRRDLVLQIAFWAFIPSLIASLLTHHTALALTSGVAMVVSQIPNLIAAAWAHWRMLARTEDVNGAPAVVRPSDLRRAFLLPPGGGETWRVEIAHRGAPVIVSGAEARTILARLLPIANVYGASASEQRAALDVIDRLGEAGVIQDAGAWATRRVKMRWWRVPVSAREVPGSIASIPASRRLALEMVIHRQVEREMAIALGASVEREWVDAEQVAAIADDLLLPPSVREKYRALRSSGTLALVAALIAAGAPSVHAQSRGDVGRKDKDPAAQADAITRARTAGKPGKTTTGDANASPVVGIFAGRCYAFSLCCCPACRAYANSADNITCIACGSAIALRQPTASFPESHNGGRYVPTYFTAPASTNDNAITTACFTRGLAASSTAIDFLSHCVTTKAMGPSTMGRNNPIAREIIQSFIYTSL